MGSYLAHFIDDNEVFRESLHQTGLTFEGLSAGVVGQFLHVELVVELQIGPPGEQGAVQEIDIAHCSTILRVQIE